MEVDEMQKWMKFSLRQKLVKLGPLSEFRWRTALSSQAIASHSHSHDLKLEYAESLSQHRLNSSLDPFIAFIDGTLQSCC